MTRFIYNTHQIVINAPCKGTLRNGGSYTLPKALVQADENSKLAIEYLIEKEYAADSGQGTDNLVLAITPQGMEYIKSK